jgi:hypothetical protein
MASRTLPPRDVPIVCRACQRQYVVHNWRLAVTPRLCHSCLLLESGRVKVLATNADGSRDLLVSCRDCGLQAEFRGWRAASLPHRCAACFDARASKGTYS